MRDAGRGRRTRAGRWAVLTCSRCRPDGVRYLRRIEDSKRLREAIRGGDDLSLVASELPSNVMAC
jgi:hypothetical protein